MRAIALGVHVLDVLVRPVESIPEGQGGTLVEQIRLTPAGSAADLGERAADPATHLHLGGPSSWAGRARRGSSPTHASAAS
jgi:hypothetical protein